MCTHGMWRSFPQGVSKAGGGLISHTHDSSTPKLHPDRVLGSTATCMTAVAPGVDLRKCVVLHILQHTIVYTTRYTKPNWYIQSSSNTIYCTINPEVAHSPLSLFPPSHLNLIVLQLLAVFKEVDGKLGVLHTMDGRSLLPHTGPKHHEGARGLELRLQPVLRVGIVVGYVDPQTAILTKNDERSAMLRTLGARRGGGGG